ncbi:MAG: DUF2911 domain-containing protein [Cyclobacteriaceae bacterium]|jgi:hypothetical protein|nr:DUF2911 domain-containing protein [Cyclobacteriaceae bacterium]
MKKFLIIISLGVLVVISLILVVNAVRLKQTKSHSPEETELLSDGNVKISVHYNRPFKKGREIFGGLVPYGKVWRTGANEATQFETNRSLKFEDKTLAPGKYSLWTVPDSTTWLVIFNAESGQWGINSKGEANRDPSLDVLTITAQAIKQDHEFEQFTIRFDRMEDEAEMVLLWDKTVVVVPFRYK